MNGRSFRSTASNQFGATAGVGHFLPPLSSATSDCSGFVFRPFRSRRAHDRLCAMAQNLKRRVPLVTIAFDATADLRACPWFHLLQTPGTRETDSGDDECLSRPTPLIRLAEKRLSWLTVR